MDELDFNNYFDKDKEELKFLLTETQVRVADLKEVFDLDETQEDVKGKLQHERDRYMALKLALIACDDNSMLSTINFDDYGTLDVNKVYGKLQNKFNFNFNRPKSEASLDSPEEPFDAMTPRATPVTPPRSRTPTRQRSKTPKVRRTVTKAFTPAK